MQDTPSSSSSSKSTPSATPASPAASEKKPRKKRTPEQLAALREKRKNMSSEERERQRAHNRAYLERLRTQDPEKYAARIKANADAQAEKYKNDPEFHAKKNEYMKNYMKKRSSS